METNKKELIENYLTELQLSGKLYNLMSSNFLTETGDKFKVDPDYVSLVYHELIWGDLNKEFYDSYSKEQKEIERLKEEETNKWFSEMKEILDKNTDTEDPLLNEIRRQISKGFDVL